MDVAEGPTTDFVRALRLAREVEALLADGSSPDSSAAPDSARAHSTRIARAMAASLVDELELLVRTPRVQPAAARASGRA